MPLSAADLGGLELVQEEGRRDQGAEGRLTGGPVTFLPPGGPGDYRLATDNITYYTADGEEAKVAVAPLDLTVVSVLPVELGQEEIAGLNIKEIKARGLPPDYRPLVIAGDRGFSRSLFLLFRRL